MHTFQQQANMVLVITLNSLKNYGTVRPSNMRLGDYHRPFRIWGPANFQGRTLGFGGR